MRRVLTFVIGAMLGGLVGSALVMLLTPQSGPSIREQIRQSSLHMKEDVLSAAAEKRIELEKQLAHLRGEVISN